MNRLSGKTAVVTGASKGIGAGIAKGLAVPDLEQGNVVIDLGILEQPFAGCETAALLKNFQVPDMIARRNP